MTVKMQQRIGSAEDPEAGFSRLVAADVDRDGNVYALDALDRQIKVFDSKGLQVRRIGRPGAGPGEFESVPRFGVNGDTIWTYNFPPGRITLFDTSGRVLSTALAPGAAINARTGTGYLTPHLMTSEGRFLSWFTRIGYSRGDGPAHVPPDSEQIPIVMFSASGAITDTVGFLATPPPRIVPPADYRGSRWESIIVGGRSYTVPVAPADLPIWLPLEDGRIVIHSPYAVADTASISVTRIGVNGDTVYHRLITYRAARYTEDVLMEAAGRKPVVIRDGVAQSTEVNPAALVRIREAMKFPPYQLGVRDAWADKSDRVWLRLSDDGANARWLLLRRDGTLRGVLALPQRARPLWSQGEDLWASVPDELDVPWLVRYSIEGP